MSATRKMETHYATAQVGKDTIESAEYFKFDLSAFDRPQRALSFKDKISDIWLDIMIPFRRLINKTKDICWEVRYGFQRMFKGYDSVDCFETYYKFTQRYYKILTDYKKNHCGYPCEMSENEWDDIVDEMIYHLYYMNEEHVEKELSKNVSEDWSPSMKTVDDIMERHKDEFFKLFSKYFFNLWD